MKRREFIKRAGVCAVGVMAAGLPFNINATRIYDYVTALEKLGYKKEQVTKILVTHKHPDHTGELRSFPNAKIYISRIEADAMDLKGDNVVRCDFSDGAYENFDKCQKIADGVYYIFAPGHTTGNSIIIVENEGLHYIIHGDVTYTDEALYMNKLSVANRERISSIKRREIVYGKNTRT